MALTRPMLRNLGITEKETLDAIMDAHGETVNPLKDSIKDLEADKLKLEQDIKNTPKAEVDGETVSKTDYDKLKGEFDTYKADVENAKVTESKLKALKTALKSEGVSGDKFIELLEAKFPLDKIELDGDKIKGWGDIVKPVKEQYGEIFGTVTTQGAGVATPPKNDATKPAGHKDMNAFIRGKTD